MTRCIVCQSENCHSKYTVEDQYGDHYDLMECNDCLAHFLDPMPTASQLQRAYAQDYYGEGNKKFNPTVEKVLGLFRSRKARSLSSYLKKGDRLLDIGCADGEFLHQLSKFGDYELHGVELEGEAARRAKERGGFQLHVGPLTDSSFPEDHFNFISLVHVFEHLPDPSRTIQIISKIAKQDAIVYIEQPNIGSWQAGLFKDKWLHLDPPRHLNMLPEEGLINLMNEHGFELEKKSYFSPQFSPFGVQQSILNKLLPKREVLYEHLKGNREYVKEYSSFSLFLQKLFHWLSFPFFVLTDLIASIFKRGGTIKLVFIKLEGKN